MQIVNPTLSIALLDTFPPNFAAVLPDNVSLDMFSNVLRTRRELQFCLWAKLYRGSPGNDRTDSGNPRAASVCQSILTRFGDGVPLFRPSFDFPDLP